MRDASSATVIVSLIRTSFLTSTVGFWKPCCSDAGAFNLDLLRPLDAANLSFAGAFFFFLARRVPCSSRASATSSASRA